MRREAGVNGNMLMSLTDRDLQETLGVENAMHRKRIMREMEGLR